MNLPKPRHLLCIHVLDARSGKMALHTQRTLHNCGAPSGAGRTEIKQVLHPSLLKISLFRRGWRILDCVCEGNSVMSVRARMRDPLQMGHTTVWSNPAVCTHPMRGKNTHNGAGN